MAAVRGVAAAAAAAAVLGMTVEGAMLGVAAEGAISGGAAEGAAEVAVLGVARVVAGVVGPESAVEAGMAGEGMAGEGMAGEGMEEVAAVAGIAGEPGAALPPAGAAEGVEAEVDDLGMEGEGLEVGAREE
ncbi:hypothetical protein HYH03_001392 [Edaphochlamys debaryana]|uniref:Uncharacterized protein n=1 Tax=Edaphochlamys debaryana TaxID=47281 RepID=A0A835YD04_9CHLO|nr:hypothetical protein HYH03_001392 [Edaphochlamys debaryana]|eukprot:KAG2500625.1 hypothetical protein HYH03_001392 [Edaphochlamys debaryana]